MELHEKEREVNKHELVRFENEKSLAAAGNKELAAFPVGEGSALAKLDGLTQLVPGLLSAESASRSAAALKESSDTIDSLKESMDKMVVLNLPEGVTFSDLLDRVDGFGGKTLTAMKDGSFYKNASISKAEVPDISLAAPNVSALNVASAALSVASVVVGQAYMDEIDKRLQGIEQGVAEIKGMLEDQAAANLEGAYRRLADDFVPRFEEYAASEVKLQAAYGEIQSIKTTAEGAWSYHLKRFDRFAADVMSKNKLSDKAIEGLSAELERLDRAAATAFQLKMCANRTAMQLDGDFSPERISSERDDVEKHLSEFARKHGEAENALRTRIAQTKGNPVSRLTGKDTARKDRLANAVSTGSGMTARANATGDSLALIDAVANKADIIAIDLENRSIRFLESPGQRPGE